MPEMPEVETIRLQLEKHVIGQKIEDVEISLPRLFKWPEASDAKAYLLHQTITALERRGKYLLFRLSNGRILVIHLRMTGRLYYQDAIARRDAYTRIVFQLSQGNVLIYADTRTLGTLYVVSEGEISRISGLATLGPEPLAADFTLEYFASQLQNRQGKIKSLLLNQQIVGGLGNIYVDESLAVAQIHPERRACELSQAEVARLYAAVNQVIHDGIVDGGTTFRDYRNSEGKIGQHQNHLWVYGQTGRPCQRCGQLIEKIVVAGRGTHFCPHCQK
ncbi:MAG: bifunctional DNA-formamidopyrimidine glycosylase/DNA-(apurinic or apyrimidinic site) lyase [Sporomusaceae bacterium]|nr:bifunctional DNA-formamidopyrimidine glycosylase/DNA-(apurinic or apyrimidinic site) lyase [Sporomusaceae bacterium]